MLLGYEMDENGFVFPEHCQRTRPKLLSPSPSPSPKSTSTSISTSIVGTSSHFSMQSLPISSTVSSTVSGTVSSTSESEVVGDIDTVTVAPVAPVPICSTEDATELELQRQQAEQSSHVDNQSSTIDLVVDISTTSDVTANSHSSPTWNHWTDDGIISLS